MKKHFATIFLLLIYTFASAQITLEEKIGQMLGTGISDWDHRFSESIYVDIEQRNLGGVILFGWDLECDTYSPIPCPQQIANLTSELQSYAGTPLFIATDQEGGIVARLDETNGFEKTYTAYQLGTTFDSEDSTRKQAKKMAQWLYTTGINNNLAPVVDLNVNPASPAIGYYQRSFCSDPVTVIDHAQWFISEFANYNIIMTLKHFPGHGSAEEDSHLGFTDITDTWTDAELLPYRHLIDDGYNDIIMVGHLYNAHIDSVYPASLSYRTIQGLLRDSLGFNGVVVSDEMLMRAITNNYSFDDAIELAINAGTDMLLYRTNIYYWGSPLAQKFIEIVKQKVVAGIISERRINESYARIQTLKSRLTGIRGRPSHRIPDELSLYVYPNPFNLSTNFIFTIPVAGFIDIDIFDITGRRVYRQEYPHMNAGRYTIRFRADNLASGTYILKLSGPESYVTRKIILIK